MSAKPITANEKLSEFEEKNESRSNAVFIGQEEFTQTNVSSKLDKYFDYNVICYNDLKKGLDYLLKFKASVLVIDIDQIDIEALRRVYEIVSYTQTPTILVSQDPSSKNDYFLPTNNSFITFLPKSLLNNMFRESLTLLLKENGITAKLGHRMQKVSGDRKPKSFYLLATLLLLEPILKIIFMKFSTDFSFEIVLRTVFSMEGIVSNFEFWVMFPLAGIALITERPWSFLVFICVQVYCIFSHLYYVEFTWPYVAASPHVSSSFLMFVNSAVILYFLVPENLRPYWNKSRMLWRDTSRYSTDLQAFFTFGTEKVNTTITNISGTGAYFKSSEKLHIGRVTQISFIIGGKVYEFKAAVKRTHPTDIDGVYGYGVCFVNLSQADKEMLKSYVGKLETRIQ